jgi:hypothetical protein
MEPVKLRNKAAEDVYFRLLARWSAATANLELYDEKSLRFLFRQLESAWIKIGYIIGDR